MALTTQTYQVQRLDNASGADLPDDLIVYVDALHVDDLRLLDTRRHRSFVQSHRARVPGCPSRRCDSSSHRRKVRVLGEVRRPLTYRRPAHVSQVVLVELLDDGIAASPRTPEFAWVSTTWPRSSPD
jgi:hypothetical protein